MFKGLTVAMMTVTFMLVGVPLLLSFVMLGKNEYAEQCNLNYIMPCFGLKDTR